MAELLEKTTCRVVHPDETYDGKQGFTYFGGISAQNVGAAAICMHLLNIAPGQRAKVHVHEAHETAIYVLSGEAEMLFGHDLEEHAVCRAGDFVYIPAGMPHLPYNATDEPCIAVIARTDPNEQESVILRPDLEARAVAPPQKPVD